MQTGQRMIGRSILAIAAIHTLFGLLVFHGTILALIDEGVIAAIGSDPMRGAVIWFLLAGFFMATTGLAVDQLEAQGLHDRLGLMGWSLLAIALLGVALMPASGLWLLLIPAFFCLRRAREKQD